MNLLVKRLIAKYKSSTDNPTPSGFIDFLSAEDYISLAVVYLEDHMPEICSAIQEGEHSES